MVTLVVGEVFVGGFQYTKVGFILLGYPAVFPKHHAVLILDQELTCSPRLTAKLCNDGTDLGIHVRYLVHQLAKFSEVTAIPSHVGIDKFCFRMLAEHTMLFGDDRLP